MSYFFYEVLPFKLENKKSATFSFLSVLVKMDLCKSRYVNPIIFSESGPRIIDDEKTSMGSVSLNCKASCGPV